MRVCMLILLLTVITGCSGEQQLMKTDGGQDQLQPIVAYDASLQTVTVEKDAEGPIWTLVEDRVFRPENPEAAPMLLGLDTFDVWPDGSIVLLDRAEGRFILADPKNGSLREGGRLGQGPGEFQRPIAVGVRVDGFDVFERLSPRLIRFNRDGVFVDTVPVRLQGDGAVMVAVPGDGGSWLVQVRLLAESEVSDVVEAVDANGTSMHVLYRGPEFTLADRVQGKPGVGVTFDGSAGQYVLAPREVFRFRLILIPGPETEPIAVESDWEPVRFSPEMQKRREKRAAPLPETQDDGDAFRYRAGVSQVVMDDHKRIWCLMPAGSTGSAVRVLAPDGRSILVHEPLTDYAQPLMRAADNGVWILDRTAPDNGIQKLARYRLVTE